MKEVIPFMGAGIQKHQALLALWRKDKGIHQGQGYDDEDESNASDSFTITPGTAGNEGRRSLPCAWSLWPKERSPKTVITPVWKPYTGTTLNASSQ